MSFNMDGYVDVATRIGIFRDSHPEGSLQPADSATPYRIETIEGQTYIVVVAAAYRSPDDPRPGVGMAYEVFPGKSSFTKGSELQNAETSAWGRAIVAALAADTKPGIASAEEVRNRQAEQPTPNRTHASPTVETPASAARDELRQLLVAKDIPLGEALVKFRAAHEGDDLPTTTNVPAIRALIEHYTTEVAS